MARDWNDTRAVQEDILSRMQAFGKNVAPIPYTETMEYREEKGHFWTVDIHVKVHRLVEFDLTGEGPTLADALRCVYLGLNSEANLRRTNGAAA